MIRRPAHFARQLLLAPLFGLIAACATQPPAPPPPPPLPMLVPLQTPPIPVPPNGASPRMYIPQPDATGQRPTPNRGLPSEETIWHARSAFNVAALNCRGPEQTKLVNDYGQFLKIHSAALNRANLQVDELYKQRFVGTNGLRVRDTHMTDIYNYFALPPLNAAFCQLMTKNADEAVNTPDDQLYAFSARLLGEIDDAFIDFYGSYDAYRRSLAGWQAIYGNRGIVRVIAPGAQSDPGGATPQ